MQKAGIPKKKLNLNRKKIKDIVLFGIDDYYKAITVKIV